MVMKKNVFLLIARFFVINFVLFGSSNTLSAQEAYSKELQKAINSVVKVKSKPSEKQKEKVVSMFEEIIRNNIPERGFAYLYLGEMYSFHSPEVIQNLPLSLAYYTKADCLLDDSTPFEKSLAVYNRGLFHYIGQVIPQNFDSAAFFFEKAAIISPARGVGIGEMYEFGIGVPQDLDLAMLYYQTSCFHGTDAYSKLYNIAYLIEQIDANSLDTIGYQKFKEAVLLTAIERNIKDAFVPLLEAAERGYVPAQFELGTNYFTGDYTSDIIENREKCEYWYKKAVDNEYIPAMHMLAVFYETIGMKMFVNTSRAIAFPLYKQAAEKGFPLSQVAMGFYYQHGLGIVPVDYNTAYQWYSAAASEGLLDGEIKIRELDALIKEEELQENLRIFQSNLNSLSQVIQMASQKYNANKQKDIAPTGLNTSSINTPKSSSNTEYCKQSQSRYNDLIKKVQNGVEKCVKMQNEHDARMEYDKSYYNWSYGSDFNHTIKINVTANQKLMKIYRDNCPEIPKSEWETVSVYQYVKK